MPVPTVNNFRFLAKYETEPPALMLMEIFEGFEIYQSRMNNLIIVVKNPKNNIYYSFEYNGNIEDIIKDIKTVIVVFWKEFQ